MMMADDETVDSEGRTCHKIRLDDFDVIGQEDDHWVYFWKSSVPGIHFRLTLLSPKPPPTAEHPVPDGAYETDSGPYCFVKYVCEIVFRYDDGEKRHIVDAPLFPTLRDRLHPPASFPF